MRKSRIVVLGAAMATGIQFAPAVALAVTHKAPASSPSPSASSAAPSGQARQSSGGSDPSTPVTFAVTTGALSISVPVSADLGSGPPGGHIIGQLGPVTVTDARALVSASWTVTASSTDYTTGGGTGAEIIPATDLSYSPGTVTTTGTITATPSDITMATGTQTVMSGTAGVGNNTASWDPAITVDVPAAAVGGTYRGSIAHSVS